MSARSSSPRRPRRRNRSRIGPVAFLLSLALVIVGLGLSPTSSGAQTTTRTGALVLYDTSSPWGAVGELHGQLAANLAGHFGTWTAKPVQSYTAGMMSSYKGVIYLGSMYDEPLPAAFIDDVVAAKAPVLWAGYNLWKATAQVPDFATRYGFNWKALDYSGVTRVDYKGRSLQRSALNQGGILETLVYDPAKVQTLATAFRADGTSFPWAVRSGNLTYLGEVPFAYMDSNDRYLIFADLLFDLLAPGTATRHRALVRIEDVGPDADPAELRAIADVLSARKIPFSVAVIAGYRDPKGTYSGGVPQSYDLASKPAVVSALKYMQSKGGTLLMHGYTHQFSNVNNPYDAVSSDDFEFFMAFVDANNNVVYNGPVPGDSQAWAAGRLLSASLAFTVAGLSQPTIFEFPHYAGSPADYAAVQSRFGVRYDRGLYFGGLLTGRVDTGRINGQFFPYAVKDLYGSLVIPENLGNVEPEAFNNHPPRFPADIMASADANLTVRDGFASFFYHPYLGTAMLTQIVDGITAKGYTFVAPSTVKLP